MRTTTDVLPDAPMVSETRGEATPEACWAQFLSAFNQPSEALPHEWSGVFGPLRAAGKDGMMVVAQLGQSLDGRIATLTGHSKYINGPAGLAHLHRLRALVDAVVVGVGTALADDPLLTVRLVAGSHPARVVIDPRGRLPADAKVFVDDGVRRILITAQGRSIQVPDGVEVVALATVNGHIAPVDILRALSSRGLKRVLIEGGAETVSRFMCAGYLDRIHVIVAPVILGSGRSGFDLPPIDRVDEAIRPCVHTHFLQGDVLFDCDLSAQRNTVSP